jgi:hypothetical protein
MVDLTDGLQFGFQVVVVLEPLFDLVFLFWPDAVLLGNAAGITDGQDPNGMTFAASALGTAFLMVDRSLEQGTADDLSNRGQGRSESIAITQRAPLFHQYK